MSPLLSVLHAARSSSSTVLSAHCSAASFKIFFTFLSHLQVVNDDLADQEYEDDFEVIMQPSNYEILLLFLFSHYVYFFIF